MKKILYFHHAIGLGGAPKSLSNLITGLDKQQYHPIVVMPKRPNNEAVSSMFKSGGAEVIEEKDIRVFNGSMVAPCRTIKGKLYSVLSYNGLVKAAKKVVAKIEPDIVHINSTCLVGAAKGAHQANPNVPVIAHVREPLLQNRWGRNLARMNRKHVNWFIAIDQFGLDSIGLTKSRGDVVFNFVDTTEYFPVDKQDRQSAREHFDWNTDRIVFLSLARVSESNGAFELAKIVSQQGHELDPRVLFVVAGFHEKPTAYERKTKELIDVTKQIVALPFVKNVKKLISAADAIIAPFTTPHSARSVFEGAALGKPSLVSALPNLQELIIEGKTGFSWSKPSELIERSNDLCDKKILEEMGVTARKHAVENFDQGKNVAKTILVYEKLLNDINLNRVR